MITAGPMWSFSGVPNSKVATLPSVPRKGKPQRTMIEKRQQPFKFFVWATAEES